MKTLIVVQARLGSSRLPGKVLQPLAGAPLLARLLERLRAVRTPATLVVATTWLPEDDPIDALCASLDTPVYRGHPTDLLDRHYQAALRFGADVVVKVPSDCPLISPAAVERVLHRFAFEPDRFDFMSNLRPATWPDGNDVEVMSLDALEVAWREAEAPWEREHTTPFLWDQPERFRVGNVTWETGLDCSRTHRFTVDYPDDLAFVARVFDALYRPADPVFELPAILSLLDAQPALLAVNRRYAGVNWYRHHLGHLRTVSPGESRPAPGESPAPPVAP